MQTTLLARALAALLLATAAFADDAATPPTTAAALGTAISYQGRLEKNGVPVNGTCNFIFGLYDAVSAGTQFGINVNVTFQPVVNGLFTATLDFGAGAFNGQARWLNIQVLGPNEVTYVTLSPRQAINAAPYALYAVTSPGGGSGPWVQNGSVVSYSGGNVGIGTTTPTSKVEIAAGDALKLTGVSPYITFKDAGAGNALSYVQGVGGDLILVPPGLGGNVGMTLKNTTGRVGVGTTAPTGMFHAQSSTPFLPAIVGVHTGNWAGVYGESQTNAGVWGRSYDAFAVYGEAVNPTAVGGYFRHLGTGEALHVDGRAVVKTLQILGGADIVEGFETGDTPLEPGTVVVIDGEHPGELRASKRAYDNRVAGVVSGAGGVAPGLRLGHERVMDGQTSVAMTGRVYARCSVQNGRIRPGDLLTTSDHAGLAMRASDAMRSNGAVLGKAMSALDAGTGLVLVLVNLQ